MLKELKIDSILVGRRHRRDMGDLTSLAECIRREGLLQPIGVTDRLELVFGERRIRAVRDILKKKTILARIVHVSSILAGEWRVVEKKRLQKECPKGQAARIRRAGLQVLVESFFDPRPDRGAHHRDPNEGPPDDDRPRAICL